MSSIAVIFVALWFLSSYLDYEFGFNCYLLGKEYEFILPTVPGWVFWVFAVFEFTDMVLDRVITAIKGESLWNVIWNKIKPYFKTKTYTGDEKKTVK